PRPSPKLPRPPSPTLFRSQTASPHNGRRTRPKRRSQSAPSLRHHLVGVDVIQADEVALLLFLTAVKLSAHANHVIIKLRPRIAGDRKSTRLNSSHGSI